VSFRDRQAWSLLVGNWENLPASCRASLKRLPALEAGLAVYVLGGFGGAAQHVANVMSGGCPKELTLEGFKANRKYLDLRKAAEERGRVADTDEK
jgi:hypothetical protein